MSRQARLDELAARHRVPGATLGILHAGRVVTLATGVLNVETGVRATPDSVFPIGSITKVYTATLALQLADEGKLDIDSPIAAALPELELAEPHAAARVTMRHLLSHTSGIEGDHFIDVGRGDDVLERYVRTCAELGFAHPVGATWSYCNTGYVIAGRVIERLTGMTWDAALRERLLDPLGLTATVTLPEEVLRFRAAHGHTVETGKPARLARAPLLPRSTGPAGLIWATAADVLAFARAHMEWTPVLSDASRTMMQTPQVELPDVWTLGSHWGLGWILWDWDGRTVFGHDGERSASRRSCAWCRTRAWPSSCSPTAATFTTSTTTCSPSCSRSCAGWRCPRRWRRPRGRRTSGWTSSSGSTSGSVCGSSSRIKAGGSRAV